MKTDQQSNSEVSLGLEQVLVAYLEATEGGEAGDRETWLASHSHVADGLHSYFDAVDTVSGIMRRLRQVTPPVACQTFGSYQLLDEIGRGGMGVVYRARHVRLDRTVALKLIRPGRAPDSVDCERFRNEADAASQLDHPNIVPIYDFGEQDGQFYFTMKLIEGTSLAEWHSDQKAGCFEKPGVADTSPQADVRSQHGQIAKVMSAIARAVQHAHQRGILHRDLKPSNILIDHDAQPWVADFGLAKQIHRDHDFTQTGAILGTPTYMAPEQTLPVIDCNVVAEKNRRATVTTSVDIYGLGAILYFLLTGRPPFKGATPLTTLALVRESDAVAPNQIDCSIDNDLSAICLKCLEKNPSDRYESAETLAQDLDRWISGQPTLARPAHRMERMWRWCRKNRVFATMIATILGLVIFGVSSLAYGIIAANKSRNNAIQQRQSALSNLRSVITEINDLENRRPDLDEMRLELLTRVQKHLEPMLNDPVHGTLADETNFWLEIDAGDVQELRGQAKDAIRHFQQARTIADRIPVDSNSSHQRLLTFAYSHLGDAELMQYRPEAVRKLFEKSLTIRQQLVDANPNAQARADLALAHLKLATGLLRLSEHPGIDVELISLAIEHAETSMPMYESLAFEEPDNVWHARFLGYGRETIAEALRRLRRWDQCIAQCRLGLESLNAAKQRLPEYQLILDVHSSYLLDVLSVCCMECGQFEDGEQAATESLQIRRRLVEPSPQAIHLRRGLIWSLDRLGQNQHGAGKIAEAIASFEQASAIGRELLGNAPELKDVRREMFVCLNGAIDASQAHAEYDDRTLQLAGQRLLLKQAELAANPEDGALSRFLLMILVELADLHICRSDLDEAQSTLESARNLLETTRIMDERPLSEEMLELRFRLLRLQNEPGFDSCSALLDVTRFQCMLRRLQAVFRVRGDHVRLAEASVALSESSSAYRQTYAAALGLAQAAHLAPEGEQRDTYLQKRDALLTRLRAFGRHADEQIMDDPAFSDLKIAVKSPR